jgi:hypothetical protein
MVLEKENIIMAAEAKAALVQTLSRSARVWIVLEGKMPNRWVRR